MTTLAQPRMATRTYLAEVYTSHPQTGQPGWDIFMVWVCGCRNMEHAIAKLKASLPNFDEVITLTETNGIEDLRYCQPSNLKVIR